MEQTAPGPPQPESAHPSATDFTARLNRLFEVMRPPGRPPLSNAAAAEAITEKTGMSISSAYLWQLRSGLKKNPTIQHVQALASFFGVPPSYLLDSEAAQKIDEQLDLLQALKDAGVRNIALRASGLNPQTLNNLSAIIDNIRELEHLPPVENNSSGQRGDSRHERE